MKRIASSLSVLALSVAVFAPVANAETSGDRELTSFNVANLAYQGRLTENGIPSYASLEASVSSGTITAEDVIQAAIDSGRLSETTLQNDAFVTAVERQLQNLVEQN
ncbi:MULTISPECIES: hypothetical protein [unclassified Leptolyngbya]|uniref:hypothetical protein n=1 Tax=unclassified Leptolyngbya TaxID=2650499 RepID=UPI001686D601|nr:MULTISPECIES: hypothetical protein [unclassified Leptolyngbya]MBD1911330.1 hypothetical protein [Leptolyngbya sp. FACHB-8]MBD2156652.1 hypothetical protein [Leptolyngbya sp. FACHB-16]